MTISRDFKGIWIPAHVWLDQRLTYFERFLLSEIHSLEGKDGCYASNEYLCEFFQENKRKIQEGIAKLKELGYVYLFSFDGRTRVLKTNLHPESDKSLINTPDMPSENDKSLFNTSSVLEPTPLRCWNQHPPHIIYNKQENKQQQQEKVGADADADVVVEKTATAKLKAKALSPQDSQKIDALRRALIGGSKCIEEEFDQFDSKFFAKAIRLYGLRPVLQEVHDYFMKKNAFQRSSIQNPPGFILNQLQESYDSFNPLQ